MGRFFLGLLIGLVILPLCGFFYFRFGYAPVATASPPMPFEKQLAHMALKARLQKEAPKNSALPANDGNYLAGAHVYRTHCAVCHGLPGQLASAISKGMFPRPPQLFKGHGVTDDPVGVTYWKVANGIRLTGMPGFDHSLSKPKVWQVSLMLANGNKLPQDVQTVLQQPPAPNLAQQTKVH
ncbi:MAG: c-type cytochrome [Terriglobia bacterium]